MNYGDVLLKLNPLHKLVKFSRNEYIQFCNKIAKYYEQKRFLKLPLEEKKVKIRQQILDHIGLRAETLESFLDQIRVLRPELYLRLIDRALDTNVQQNNTGVKFAPIIINKIENPNPQNTSPDNPLNLQNEQSREFTYIPANIVEVNPVEINMVKTDTTKFPALISNPE